MDFAQIEEWLKTSLPGIIILGAVGSLFAAAIILLAKRFLLPLFSKFLEKSLFKFFTHFANPAAKKIARFIVKRGIKNLQLYYLLQVMKFTLALFLGTCSFVLFAVSLFQSGENLARPSILIPLVFSFLCLWYALRCIAVVIVPLYVDVQEIAEKAKAEVLAELQGKNES